MATIDKLSLSLTDGENFTFKQFDITFNNLTVMVGANNVGKTLINKLTWFSSWCLYTAQFLYTTSTKEKVQDIMLSEIQHYFKLTFSKTDDFDGWWEITGENVYRFKLTFEKGKLTDIEWEIINPGAMQAGGGKPLYNSRGARTFDDYKKYQKLKSKLAPDMNKENLEELCEFYPLYDVIWFEHVYNTTKILQTHTKDGMPDNFNNLDLLLEGINLAPEDIQSIVLEDTMPCFKLKDQSIKRFDCFGSGAQAILMMTIFSSLWQLWTKED